MGNAAQYRYILERESVEAGPQATRGNRTQVRRWKQVLLANSREMLMQYIELHPAEKYQIVDRFPNTPLEDAS